MAHNVVLRCDFEMWFWLGAGAKTQSWIQNKKVNVTLFLQAGKPLSARLYHTNTMPLWPYHAGELLSVAAPISSHNFSVLTTFPIYYAIFMRNHRIIIWHVVKLCVQAGEPLSGWYGPGLYHTNTMPLWPYQAGELLSARLFNGATKQVDLLYIYV